MLIFFYQSTYNLDQIGNWQLKKITSLLSLHKNENRLELYGLLFTVFALLFWLCVCLALLFFMSVGWQGQWPLPFFFFLLVKWWSLPFQYIFQIACLVSQCCGPGLYCHLGSIPAFLSKPMLLTVPDLYCYCSLNEIKGFII